MPSIDVFKMTSYNTLEEFLFSLLNNEFMAFVAIIAVVFLIKAGIDYILSRGDEKKTSQSQKAILFIIIGVVLCFISPLIVKFVMESLSKL